jgi:hypothetical protein
MKLFNFSAVLVFLFLLSGCTTVDFVRKDLTPKKTAVLRYSPQSSAKGDEKHKAKLSEQARGFCGGDFEITKEYEALQETGSSTGVGTGVGFGMGGIFIGGANRNEQMYHFVEIACK